MSAALSVSALFDCNAEVAEVMFRDLVSTGNIGSEDLQKNVRILIKN